jgi:hypothetical protein
MNPEEVRGSNQRLLQADYNALSTLHSLNRRKMMEIIEHVPGPGSGDEEGISRRDLLTTAARLGTGLAIGAAALGTGTLQSRSSSSSSSRGSGTT